MPPKQMAYSAPCRSIQRELVRSHCTVTGATYVRGQHRNLKKCHRSGLGKDLSSDFRIEIGTQAANESKDRQWPDIFV